MANASPCCSGKGWEEGWDVIDRAQLPDPVATARNAGFLGVVKDFISSAGIADRVRVNRATGFAESVPGYEPVLST